MKKKYWNNFKTVVFVSLITFVSSCDVLESDKIPEIEDLDPNIKVDLVEAYSFKGQSLALDMQTLFPNLNYKGISENVEQDAQYITEGATRPVLLYKSENPVTNFLIEFEDENGDPVVAKVNLEDGVETECGAENFTGLTIKNNTKFTIDLLLNDDLCAAREVEIKSIGVFTRRKETPNQGVSDYKIESRLEGISVGDASIFENNFSLYTLIPDSNFIGTLEFEYTVAINFDPEAGHDPDSIYSNPGLSEFYSHHNAVMTIEE